MERDWDGYPGRFKRQKICLDNFILFPHNCVSRATNSVCCVNVCRKGVWRNLTLVGLSTAKILQIGNWNKITTVA